MDCLLLSLSLTDLSAKYSALDREQKGKALDAWRRKWQTFVEYIVRECAAAQQE